MIKILVLQNYLQEAALPRGRSRCLARRRRRRLQSGHHHDKHRSRKLDQPGSLSGHARNPLNEDWKPEAYEQ
jgi:hypothetical protein